MSITLFYILILLLALFLISYFFKILDFTGSIFAFVLGFTVSYFGSIYFLVLLIIFVAVSHITTEYKHSLKENITGFENTRSWKSVVSKGSVPLIVSLLPLDFTSKSVLFTVAVAAATSDTISGEMGVLSGNAYYITTLKRARPGDDGAVSAIGELWALAGSILIAIPSLLFFNISTVYLLIIIIFGFLGSQLDSLFGLILERRGWVKKYTVNILAIGISIILAYLFML